MDATHQQIYPITATLHTYEILYNIKNVSISRNNITTKRDDDDDDDSYHSTECARD